MLFLIFFFTVISLFSLAPTSQLSLDTIEIKNHPFVPPSLDLETVTLIKKHLKEGTRPELPLVLIEEWIDKKVFLSFPKTIEWLVDEVYDFDNLGCSFLFRVFNFLSSQDITSLHFPFFKNILKKLIYSLSSGNSILFESFIQKNLVFLSSTFESLSISEQIPFLQTLSFRVDHFPDDDFIVELIWKTFPHFQEKFQKILSTDRTIKTLSTQQCHELSTNLLKNPSHVIPHLIHSQNWRIHSLDFEPLLMILKESQIASIYSNSDLPCWYSTHDFIYFSHKKSLLMLTSQYAQSFLENNLKQEYLGFGFVNLYGALHVVATQNISHYHQLTQYLLDSPLFNDQLFILRISNEIGRNSIEVLEGAILEGKSNRSVFDTLNNLETQPTIDLLMQDSLIASAFQKKISEFGTVQQHVQHMLTLYQQHFSKLFPLEIHAPFRLLLVFYGMQQQKTTLLSDNQENLPIFDDSYFIKKYISVPLLKIFQSFLQRNIIHSYLENQLSLQDTKLLICEQAQYADLPVSVFFKFSVICYLCDTGSDPSFQNTLSDWETPLDSKRYALKEPIYETKLVQLEQVLLEGNVQYELSYTETPYTHKMMIIVNRQHDFILTSSSLPSTIQSGQILQQIC